MRIIAIMPVRNEDWCLGFSARAALMWADELVILNHASTDGTQDICLDLTLEYEGRVSVVWEDSPVWEEMKHRQRLLEQARARGGTHIAMVDADEAVTGNLLDGAGAYFIRQIFRNMPPGRILQIPWLCLRGSMEKVHVSGPWADGQDVSTGFVDSPELHWSSGARGGYDFHHRHPMGRQCVPFGPMRDRSAGLMHLQFLSERRLRAKQALYKMTEVLRWPDREPVHMVDQRYNLAVYGNYSGTSADLGKTLAEAPLAAWWTAYLHLMEHIHIDALPWQETEVLRLLKEHGADRFRGLDLFGVERQSCE